MPKTLLLVGTRKGAFLLESDADRRQPGTCAARSRSLPLARLRKRHRSMPNSTTVLAAPPVPGWSLTTPAQHCTPWRRTG